MIIQIDNRSGEVLPEDRYLALASFVLNAEQKSDDVELSISLVESAEIQALNKEYRKVDAPTDVLSFECDEQILGDVIICPEVAAQHAQDFDSTLDDEMNLMLVHGILHLLGYDHIDDAEAQIMESQENELLRLWRQNEA